MIGHPTMSPSQLVAFERACAAGVMLPNALQSQRGRDGIDAPNTARRQGADPRSTRGGSTTESRRSDQAASTKPFSAGVIGGGARRLSDRELNSPTLVADARARVNARAAELVAKGRP